MLAVLREPGTPTLDYWQIRAFGEVVDAANDYERDLIHQIDEFSTEEEMMAAVVGGDYIAGEHIVDHMKSALGSLGQGGAHRAV
jgi:hypothetical protein